MSFFWASIIFPFIYLDINIDNSYFIYVVCRINLKYERYMVEEIRKVLDPFGTYTDNMFDPLDPFNLLSVIYFHDDI
ncbi:hypothetical protein GLOIN_2v1549193 [Rhizophagus irregularis DAOM 181602=DAOM 197198]|uniref:Uncharacterized protein n=1 Tax=Rhizophagus irregularis (strain DAOM 181602 / DAOM 197198 / MUCL 43194) TaxID=747089 RepID=A0A2P4QI04_RHIID|nr:hypothetical protein GLOIN_2v1549193 [Rhizophagus irregularis DAOM 181602=DAOM 197198]POG77271.1 hypothetical protein GLOIN_2v1549193 [Rhizophagus irregularis DAOM 181602=DAOM 197198]|eukprot:XP_025184137.1 hypothetical protein GLOIN_2v1549193 [Rhizophagus irregularis DAOM 181602=DAOM 197198]